MPPTQSDPRSGLVDDLIKRKASDEEITRALEDYDGFSRGAPISQSQEDVGTPVTGYGGPAGNIPPTTYEDAEKARQFYTEQLPRGAVALGSGLLSGGLTAAMSIPAALITETGVVGTADLAYQGIRKLFDVNREVDPIASLKIGATSAAVTGIVRTGADIFAKRASIAPKMVRYFRNPKTLFRWNRTFGEAGENAELLLGDDVKTAFKTWDTALTAPRIAKQHTLQQATAAGTQINSKPIIDALENVKLVTPKTAAGRALNKDLVALQDSFKKIRKVAANPYAGQVPGGPTAGTPAQVFKSVRTDLTPIELDEFLTKEIDNRIYSLSGTPKDQMLAKGLADARSKIRETLLNALPPEARTQTQAIYEELTMQEEVKKAIQPSLVSLETKMRNLFKPGHAGELRAIQYLSEKTGIPFTDMAFKIAQQRQFSGDPRISPKALDFLAELFRGMVATPTLKVLAPAHAVIAPSAGAYMAIRQEGKRLDKEKSRNLPLQPSHSQETP